MKPSLRTHEVPPDRTVPDRPAPGLRWLSGGLLLLWVGVVVFALSIVAGVARSFAVHRTLPQVGVEYTTELNRVIQQKGAVAALPEIRAAARIDYENVQAVTKLLETARQAGNKEDVLWSLTTLVRLKPEDPDIRNQLVSALLDLGQFGEALAQGQFALWLSPESPEAYCNLGRALVELNRKPEAAMVYRRALELDPYSPAARRALERELRGF